MNKETLLDFKQSLIDLLLDTRTLGCNGLCYYLQIHNLNKRHYRDSYQFVMHFLNYHAKPSFTHRLELKLGILSPERIALAEELITYIDNILYHEAY